MAEIDEIGEALTGDLVEPWKVTNPLDEDAREEVYMGGTTDDIEIERDPNEADWPEHMREQMQRRELQEESELALVQTLRTNLNNLLDAGVVYYDEEYEIYRPTKNERIDALELDIWDRINDDDPAQTYRCYDAQPVVTDIPIEIEGVITIEIVWWLMGPHGIVGDGDEGMDDDDEEEEEA